MNPIVRRPLLPLLLFWGLGLCSAAGGDPGVVEPDPTRGDRETTETGGAGIFERGLIDGGILFPHIHLHGVVGATTADGTLPGRGHHDPAYDGFSFNQGLEAGLSLRAGEHLEGFVTAALTQDRASRDWDVELEEAFAKLHALPGGFELRGGRFFQRFGRQNALHPHGYDFVDQSLLVNSLLGEHGLVADGGELTWNIPLPFPAVVSAGYGRAVGHGHSHPHPHDHDHDDEADRLTVSGNLVSARLLARYHYNDFHRYSGGLSFARGRNGYGRHTSVAAVDFEYLWRENGLEAGGRALRWNTEVFSRRAGAVGGSSHHHDEDDSDRHDPADLRPETLTGTGVMTSVVWTLHPRWDAALRAEWIDGDGALDHRRLSPAVTFHPDARRRTKIRLQYNFDRLHDSGSDHSVWLGFGIDLGGAEVR